MKSEDKWLFKPSSGFTMINPNNSTTTRQAQAYLTQQLHPQIISQSPAPAPRLKNLSASPMASQYSGLVRLRALIRPCVDCVFNQPINTGSFDKSVGYGVVVPTQEHRDATTEDVEASFLLLGHQQTPFSKP
ncbi:hypothetical protein LWI29_006323 [Acer saccharum]|uniref:Uncharacterized protein n=1 Tax=Acer saccharum TaxID=4024 RepID=A0AA39RBP8_ACESA|nr:hypothetical protein LWI29_006323 [Acer saccharum]